MSKNRFCSKARHHRNLRTWQRKQRKLQTRKRAKSTSAFDSDAFPRDFAGVCERHGVPVFVPIHLVDDNQVSLGGVCLGASNYEQAKELFELFMGQPILFPDRNGYGCFLVANDNGDSVVERLHEVIAKRMPNPENKTRIRHKDGDKLNNTREHLEWY